jgi:hypothetical protein
MKRVEAFEASLKMFSSLGPALNVLHSEISVYKNRVKELEQVLEQTGRTKRAEVDEIQRINDEIKLNEAKKLKLQQMHIDVLTMAYNIVRDTYNDAAHAGCLVDAPAA